MKASIISVLCLVAIAFTGVALAGPGPASPLYLTYSYVAGFGNIAVVQGNTSTGFAEAYGGPDEIPIAVSGDVRTTGYCCGIFGGQYSLVGVPTGTSYVLPFNPQCCFYDSTSDGRHNYLVNYSNGNVYQTARDFTNPVLLFNSGAGDFGITYDRANNSLWISGWDNSTVTDYSLSGGFISSFSTGHKDNTALALDPADHTLWLVDQSSTGSLEQYSTAGALLSGGPYVGGALGGEFNFSPVPEPGTLVMFGSGILGLAGVLRRKINL